jgi:hypothetical protein
MFVTQSVIVVIEMKNMFKPSICRLNNVLRLVSQEMSQSWFWSNLNFLGKIWLIEEKDKWKRIYNVMEWICIGFGWQYRNNHLNWYFLVFRCGFFLIEKNNPLKRFLIVLLLIVMVGLWHKSAYLIF